MLCVRPCTLEVPLNWEKYMPFLRYSCDAIFTVHDVMHINDVSSWKKGKQYMYINGQHHDRRLRLFSITRVETFGALFLETPTLRFNCVPEIQFKKIYKN